MRKTIAPIWRQGFSWLTGRLRNRSDSEHEQAILRVIIGAIASIYIAVAILSGPQVGRAQLITLWMCIGFVPVSLLIAAWIVVRPAACPARRILGMCLDVGATTAGLYLNGHVAAPLFVIYLWVTFGNGFRFGLPYLAISAALSVAGFASAAQFQQLWRDAPHVTSGILIGLVILPAYVAALLRKLQAALSRAEAANEAKSQFLANISHEIRTPLHAILGVNELLLHTPLSRKQRRFADLVQRSASWLLQIVNEVLSFSKLESGRMDLETTSFDLRRSVLNVVELHREASSPKGLAVSCELDPAIPEQVRGDPLRLTQVLNNLVGNAVKFTPEGRISARARVRDKQADKLLIEFEVVDTGIGIPPEARERIFEPFSQADGSTTRKYGGTGLGLSIASKLVEKMGGKLELDSTAGLGSVFRFTLPFTLGEAAEESPTPGAAESCPSDSPRGPRWARAPKILAVEDNAINRELLGELLEGFGCVVQTATDGVAALDAAQREAFDLVLMDCQMPGMDGFSTTQALRRHQAAEGELPRTPVVALTAHSSPQDRQACLQAGMDDYLSKPFRANELLAVLQRWLPELKASGAAGPTPPAAPEVASTRSFEQPPATDPAQRPKQSQLTHDLNNLIFVIMGNAELCKKNLPEGSRESRQAQRIIRAASRAADLLAAKSGEEMPNPGP